MLFERNRSIEKLGEIIGYVAGYFLFTTLLFFVLTFFDKLPEKWTYYTVLGITLLITVSGIFFKRALK